MELEIGVTSCCAIVDGAGVWSYELLCYSGWSCLCNLCIIGKWSWEVIFKFEFGKFVIIYIVLATEAVATV